MKDIEYFLSTQRLRFRHWTDSDAELAHQLWGDPKVTRLIESRPQLTREETRAILFEHLRWQEADGIQYWPMFMRKEGTFVGCCGLRLRDGNHDIPELGFHVCSRYWGQGYAKEGAAAVIRYAFKKLRFVKLYAGHHPENKPSEHILQELGFVPTGMDVYPPTGMRHPSYILEKEAYCKVPVRGE